MSNYRRLISYIYAYEGGVKGKNIGYAKVEVRSEQCRIYVNVKKVYVGRNDIGVYLLTPAAEIFLGRIFVRGGNGEFRITVAADKVDGKGVSLDQCYGLTIHDSESSWQSYTTIWEDAVAQAAEIELADVTAENVRKQNAQQNGKETSSRTEGDIYSAEPYSFPVSREIEQELERESQTASAESLEKAPMKMETAEVMRMETINETGAMKGETIGAEPETMEEETIGAELETIEKDPIGEEAENIEAESIKTESIEGKNITEKVMEEKAPTEKSRKAEPDEGEDHDQEKSGPEDPVKLAELDRQEMEQLRPNQFWNRMQQRYARVLAFDYDKGCEILSIKPQDIGLLPREIWAYGNNSFLLHGYYNYRHIILARLDNPAGEPRYLLGVPGHYFSNEKYMATMFGFPHFVIARKQPDGDGRFGYWYTDIRL